MEDGQNGSPAAGAPHLVFLSLLVIKHLHLPIAVDVHIQGDSNAYEAEHRGIFLTRLMVGDQELVPIHVDAGRGHLH